MIGALVLAAAREVAIASLHSLVLLCLAAGLIAAVWVPVSRRRSARRQP